MPLDQSFLFIASLFLFIFHFIFSIFKKGSVIGNYRPISLLSIPSKILEHQVCDILDDLLSKHSLKNPAQWGFAKGLSAEGMLLSLTDR